MGLCQSTENRPKTIDLIRKTNPLFHERNAKEKINKQTEYSPEIYTTCIQFVEKKNQLSKANYALYKKFFNQKDKSKRLEVDHIKADDDKDLFYFFFNKRIYKELSITESRITFPKFSFRYYPMYEEETSTLNKIVLTNSIMQFDDKLNNYLRLDNCTALELSYCNIETIPEAFCKIKSIQKLCLRRNVLKSLPKLFCELKELIEVDLSENRFTCLPKEIDFNEQKITKLNLNANMISGFEIAGKSEKSKLEYLFLAQNNLAKIPSDLKKFNNLKYVNLDENNIMEKTLSLIEEIQLPVKISCLKNKGISEMIEIIKPEGGIKTKRKEAEEKQKKKEQLKKSYSTLLKQQTIIRKEIEYFKTIKTLDVHTLDTTTSQNNSYESLVIKSPRTQIEQDIALFVNELIEEAKLTTRKSELEERKKYILEKQYCFMIEKIEHLIHIGREKELGSIENYELKDLFKKCYGTYLKMKEYNNTGSLSCKIDEMEYFEKQYFLKKVYHLKSNSSNINNNQSLIDDIQQKENNKEDNRIKLREDVSNLIFLKKINQMIAFSKVKMFLQYLGNIDLHIRDNLLNLWESQDNNAFILVLTEMKLFIREMIDFYKSKMTKGFYDVKYEIITSEEKNVIHMIFHNEFTLRILYRLGIQERKEIFKEYEQEQITFNIKNYFHIKHTQFENFLMRFISVLKTTKADPIDFV